MDLTAFLYAAAAVAALVQAERGMAMLLSLVGVA
jgi:hypothetical protein